MGSLGAVRTLHPCYLSDSGSSFPFRGGRKFSLSLHSMLFFNQFCFPFPRSDLLSFFAFFYGLLTLGVCFRIHKARLTRVLIEPMYSAERQVYSLKKRIRQLFCFFPFFFLFVFFKSSVAVFTTRRKIYSYLFYTICLRTCTHARVNSMA